MRYLPSIFQRKNPFLVCVCAIVGSVTAWGVEVRPNILIILADDQGAHLSAVGTPGIDTPAVDELARKGTLFTRAYSVVASCSPSRSALLTGMYPHSNGHWRNTATPELSEPDSQFTRQSTKLDEVGVHEDIVTLNEILGEAGYFRAITQKFHLSPPWKFPFDARDPVGTEPEKFQRVIGEFIAAAGERPFFIQANVAATHRPFPAHLKSFHEPWPEADRILVPPYLPDTPAMRADLQQYFAAVELADRCAAAILNALDEAGVRENTLVIYTSDQGEPYHRAKATAYEGGIHVPLVIGGRGLQQGVVSDALVSEVDILSTVLDYVNLPVPAAAQGQSLLPILTGRKKSIEGRNYVFAEHNSHGPAPAEINPNRAATDGRFYYILNLMPERSYELPEDLRKPGPPWFNGSYEAALASAKDFPEHHRQLTMLLQGRPKEELYDLQTDPGQLHNLADQPEFSTQLHEMRQAVATWRNATWDVAEDPREITRRRTRNLSDKL